MDARVQAQVKRAARTLRKKMNHWKRKFCEAMAKLAVTDDYLPWNMKWHKRWQELAEKFKPNSTHQQKD